jgi:hypothetical protein
VKKKAVTFAAAFTLRYGLEVVREQDRRAKAGIKA